MVVLGRVVVRKRLLTGRQANPFQPDWQDHFWGSNYARLAELKKKWGPEGIFYAISTPGTED